MTSLAFLQKTRVSSLADPRLFREFAYVGGAWTAGSSPRAIDVSNPVEGARGR
jgi:aspartate-semialdehyde dehydrogenase